jgi:hypothetical protein
MPTFKDYYQSQAVLIVRFSDPGVVRLVTHPSRSFSVSIMGVDLSTTGSRWTSVLARIRCLYLAAPPCSRVS